MFESWRTQRLNSQIAELTAQRDSILKQIEDAKQTLDATCCICNNIETMEEYGVPYYDDSLDELEHKRYLRESWIAREVERGIWSIEQTYLLNGSKAKGEEMQKAFGAGIVYSLNAYIAAKEKNLTEANLETNIKLVQAKFDKYVAKCAKMGIGLNAKYLEHRLDLMSINLAIKLKQKAEKTKMREEAKRLREQEQLLIEAEREQARLQKDRRMYEQNLADATSESARKEFEAKLAEIDKRVQDIDYRTNNLRAGYLYITSTPSMPNMTKIGATRRLNPLRRIQELSSASVPFPFVCHGLVFSDDVFLLESAIHKYFDAQRVNKENGHKEFFAISPSNAISALRDVFHVDVHFVNEQEEEE
nr:MAG TPA: hypothetical protein [Caudoviricetes sp.]